jgi:hypothetical protein
MHTIYTIRCCLVCITVASEAWDEPYMRGANHAWHARMAAIRGDRAAAMDHLRRAIAGGVTHSSLHSDMDLVVLLDHAPFRELLRPQG